MSHGSSLKQSWVRTWVSYLPILWRFSPLPEFESQQNDEPGLGDGEMDSQGVCGFLIRRVHCFFLVLFHCGCLFFVFFPDLNMNHLIQIHPNLASWNRAEKEPLNPPYSLPFFLFSFSSFSCRLSPQRPLFSGWEALSEGAFLGIQLAKALHYSISSGHFP